MYSQNNMAKEISSLQNHIVWSCSTFVTQECSHHAQPRWQAKQLFHTLVISNFIQFTRNTWVWAMDIELWVEWNIMMGVMWEDKKGESVTLMRLVNGLGRCPSIDFNARSRDCHATDALELWMYESSTKETKWVCIQLACSWTPRAFWGSPSLEYTSQVL